MDIDIGQYTGLQYFYRIGSEKVVFVHPYHSSVCLSGCLYFIAKALERDHCYTKGLVLKEKIFEEQPCLKADTKHMFAKW